MSKPRHLVPTIAALGTVVLIAAYASTVGASPDRHSTSVSAKPMTAAQVRAAGKNTVTMYDFETTGGLSPALNTLIHQFEKKFPNITIKRTSRDFNDYGKTIGLLMSSSGAPDIAEANVVMARTLIPAHLISNLSPYYTAYGWTKQYPKAVLGLLKSANGKIFGSGPYWGQAIGGNMVGVYYNKQMLTSLGLKIPQSLGQFESDLALAKSKGQQPIQLGNLDKYPANHLLSTMMNDFGNPQAIRDWIYGVPGSTFASPAITQAAQKLQDWAKAGYIPSQTNGTTYNDAVAAFNKGQGLFYITGSWEEPIFHKAMGNNVGFFLLPPATLGAKPYATGWLTNPFAISTKSKHAALAAYLLAFMSGPQGNKTAVTGGYLPFTKTAPTADLTENDVVAAWEQEIKNSALVAYLDFATPSMDNVLFPQIQSLIANQTTASQFVKTVQANWVSYYK